MRYAVGFALSDDETGDACLLDVRCCMTDLIDVESAYAATGSDS